MQIDEYAARPQRLYQLIRPHGPDVKTLLVEETDPIDRISGLRSDLLDQVIIEFEVSLEVCPGIAEEEQGPITHLGSRHARGFPLSPWMEITTPCRSGRSQPRILISSATGLPRRHCGDSRIKLIQHNRMSFAWFQWEGSCGQGCGDIVKARRRILDSSPDGTEIMREETFHVDSTIRDAMIPVP